jgi:hypothetical protein
VAAQALEQGEHAPADQPEHHRDLGGHQQVDAHTALTVGDPVVGAREVAQQPHRERHHEGEDDPERPPAAPDGGTATGGRGVGGRGRGGERHGDLL